MIMPDVNVVIGAMRPDDPRHGLLSSWLAQTIGGEQPLGLSVLVLGGVVRIVTTARLFPVPSAASEVLRELDRLINHRNVQLVYPTDRHWATFSGLCRATGIQGPKISDVQHAAIAIEHDATWVSLDRDFARFPGLKWELPRLP